MKKKNSFIHYIRTELKALIDYLGLFMFIWLIVDLIILTIIVVYFINYAQDERVTEKSIPVEDQGTILDSANYNVDATIHSIDECQYLIDEKVGIINTTYYL